MRTTTASHGWTVNGLSELTGLDRRVIKKRLAGLKPVSKEAKLDRYASAEALVRIYGVKQQPASSAKTRMEEARARTAEVEAARAGKEVIDVEVVTRAWDDIVQLFKNRLLLAPTRFESQFRSGITARDARVLVEREVDEALHELATKIEYFKPEADSGDTGEDRPSAGEAED